MKPKTAEPSGFLVSVRCSRDDVPLGFFSTKRAALKFARKCKAFDGGLSDSARKLADAVNNCNTGDAVSLSLIEFKSGVPQAMTIPIELEW